MASSLENRCFVGGLSWSITDRGLEDAFRSFGSIVEAKVMTYRNTGRSRGFGFVTFGDQHTMNKAIEAMHGKELEGRVITVSKAIPKMDDDNEYGGAYDNGGSRGGYSRGGGPGSDECFRCGRPGHWARDCPTNFGNYPPRDRYPPRYNDRYGDRDLDWDRYGGGGGGGFDGGRYGDRGGDRYGGYDGRYDDHGGDRYEDRYRDRYSDGYGKDRYQERGSVRGGDRYGIGGPMRYEGSYRDRAPPYERPSRGRGGGGRPSYDRF